MRVLITGTGGFVGSHVLEEILAATDWHVVSVDSLTRHNGTMDNIIYAMLATQAGSDRARVTHVTHDLTVPFSPAQLRRIGGIDYVVNVASLCQVDASIHDPRDFIKNNVDLQLTMLELARTLKPRRFIHMSTDEVYGPGEPTTGTDHRPSSPYAASKAAQEDISRSYARTFDVPVTIVNSANMFGERQSQLAFIPRVVDMIRRGESIPIHFHDGEPGGRHYTYVRNVAGHVVRLLIDATNSGDQYHWYAREALRGQEYITNDVLVQRIAALMEPCTVSFHAVVADDVRPGYDPRYARLSGDNWQPRVDVSTGLRQTVRWLSEQ